MNLTVHHEVGFFTCVLRRAKLLLFFEFRSLFCDFFDLFFIDSIIVVSSNFAGGIPISPELCDVGTSSSAKFTYLTVLRASSPQYIDLVSFYCCH